MVNLKINSTMESKEPESSEALKSERNTEIMKNNLNSEGSQVAHTNVTQQDRSPIRFHRVHSEYITMSNDYCTARVEKLFSSEAVYSSRPIAVDEKVFLYLELVADDVGGYSYFYFGFTNCDPNTITEFEFPKEHKPVKFSWDNINGKEMTIIFHFCVEPSGEVWCGINDTDMSFLFEKININLPFWAVITPVKSVTSLKFIDCPNENKTEELKLQSLKNPSLPTRHASTELSKTAQKQIMKGVETKLKPNKKSGLDEKTEENEESASTALGRGSGVTPTNVTLQDLPPVRFHRVHGVCIKMSDDYCTARMDKPNYSEIHSESYFKENKNLMFSSRPIAYGEKVFLRLKSSKKYLDKIDFGVTDCDPNSITDLKSWNDGYWFSDLGDGCSNKTNILCLCVKQSGELTCVLKTIGLIYSFENFNINGPLWTVLRVPYTVINVEFINSSKGTKSEEYRLLSDEKHSLPTTNALSTNEEETGTSNKNTKTEGDDEEKIIPADSNILTGMPRTDVTSNTKGQTFLFDWGVESSVKSEPEFKKTESNTSPTVQEAFKLNVQPSTSNTSAELVQPTSSADVKYADVKYTQKPADYDAMYFGKIVEYHINRVPEDKRLKSMQKILEVLDNSFK